MQCFQNYIDRFGLVKVELECDQEPCILVLVNVLIKRYQYTILMVIVTPQGSKGSLGRGE